MSKFKESLTYIKYMINDPVYHTNNEEVFERAGAAKKTV